MEPQLIRLGYQIITISPDQPSKLIQAIQEHKWSYLLLSDSKMTGARAFGIAFKVGAKTLEQNENFRIRLEQPSGEKHHLLPVPAVFIVAKDSIIKFEYVNPNYKVRLSPELLLAGAKYAPE